MSRCSHNRFRPTLESLESRLVPTVSYHGGAIMPHVETQAIYLGSDWSSNWSLYRTAVTLERFDNFLVHSSFMDNLTRAGYGVGRGTSDTGILDNTWLDKNYYLQDSDIQNEIQSLIGNGDVQYPDANRLYVVYVEPGVVIQQASGETSAANFYGYHSSFAGYDAWGDAVDIRYAVIAYAGGPNATWPGLSSLGTMTVTASHEIAEAVTDPDVGYGWTEPSGAEVGDINREIVSLGGYDVQSIINRHDVPMVAPGGKLLFHGQRFATHVASQGHSEHEVEIIKPGSAEADALAVALAGSAKPTHAAPQADLLTLYWSSPTDATFATHHGFAR